MKDLIIYHNSRCSKSRQTLQIIKDHGIKPTIVEYLKTPLNKFDLENISRLLNKRPKDFVRKNEADFKENNINKDQFDPITIKVAAKLTEAAVLTKLLEEKTPDYALFKLFASMQIGNQADVDRIIDVAVCENKPRYGIGDETAYNLSRDERNMRLSRQALKSLNAKKQAH